MENLQVSKVQKSKREFSDMVLTLNRLKYFRILVFGPMALQCFASLNTL